MDYICNAGFNRRNDIGDSFVDDDSGGATPQQRLINRPHPPTSGDGSSEVSSKPPEPESEICGAGEAPCRDIEHTRQIVEYDDLLAGLSRARDHLGAEDRPALLAAESILLRLVRGPVSLDDLKGMSRTVATLGLSIRLDAISDRRQPATSL